jgi:hypothetical protein
MFRPRVPPILPVQKGKGSLLEKDSSNMGPHFSVAKCNLGIAKAELQLKRPDEAADAYASLGRIEAAQASHSATKDARPHWEAARNSFRMSPEQLSNISQPNFSLE